MVCNAQDWDKLIGDFQLFTITPEVDMSEVAANYDAVIVNFYDSSKAVEQRSPSINDVFKESISIFRVELI